jgi:uncharacterized protein YkwD
MNKVLRAIAVIAGSIALSLLLLGSLSPSALVSGTTVDNHFTVSVLIDDFAPQRLPGQSFWPHNRLGGDRGRIDGPGSGDVVWGRGRVTVTITSGANAAFGVWTSFTHPIRDHAALDFPAIFPKAIAEPYQGQVTALQLHVLDGAGTLAVELHAQHPVTPSQEIVKWSESVVLSGGSQQLQFTLPITLGEVQNLNWLLRGNAGDFVVVDRVTLSATVPLLTPPQRAFLWSYAMLLDNWSQATGLTRDHAYWGAGEFDNISASGMQAAAAVVAWRLGFVSQISATAIVSRTSAALLNLPRCHGLWPHFITNGTTTPTIVSGTEWSSIDTVIAAVALLEAQQALGLDTTATAQLFSDMLPPELILSDGSISHGYTTDTPACHAPGQTDLCACSERIGGGWQDFGTESWLVNLGYAINTGQPATFDHTPPTFNGSGFIDELAWLLVPSPSSDRWGTRWGDYRQQAMSKQFDYFQNHACYGGPPRLFGLSAGEVPDPSSVPITQTYQAFGVGGVISPNDDIALLGHGAIVPHYAGMVSAISPTQASALWDWLETKALFTPLNNVESLMMTDEPTCTQITWNALKGSWNLSLQTLGWGRLLVDNDHPLYQAMWANDHLQQGYLAMVPNVYLPLIMRQPTPTPTPTPTSAWLAYVNTYRALANLPSVSENPTWSDGDWKHARYMVKNDFIGHTEDPGNPWYTPEGLAAAQNGNTFVSSSATSPDTYAIDFWMRGPFHAVGVLDPSLQQVGYGSYREADGGWQMGATLDVIRGLGSIPPSVSFPIRYPGDGTTTGLRSYVGGEWPDPLTACPGYTTPSGLPIILQIGPGNLTPSVTAHSFLQGATPLEHCVFDETNYTNLDSSTQSTGRNILNSRDAIVLIPRQPLTPGATYTVSITTNGQIYTWSFTVSSTAQAMDQVIGLSLMR